MAYKYSMEGAKETTARAVGTSLPISRKVGIEICNYLRGRTVAKAKTLLGEVMEMKRHVPMKRFTEGAGHKRGETSGPGKFPIKASGEILAIVKLAESNAQFKGLNTDGLVIKHLSCQQAPTPYHGSRHRGRKMKRAHIEIIVEETKKSAKTEKAKKPAAEKKEEKKAEPKAADKSQSEKSPAAQKADKQAAAQKVATEAKEEAKVAADDAKAEQKQQAEPKMENQQK